MTAQFNVSKMLQNIALVAKYCYVCINKTQTLKVKALIIDQ